MSFWDASLRWDNWTSTTLNTNLPSWSFIQLKEKTLRNPSFYRLEFTVPSYHETIKVSVPRKVYKPQESRRGARQRSNTGEECLKIGRGAFNFFLHTLTEATGVPHAHSLEIVLQFFLEPATDRETIGSGKSPEMFLKTALKNHQKCVPRTHAPSEKKLESFKILSWACKLPLDNWMQTPHCREKKHSKLFTV